MFLPPPLKDTIHTVASKINLPNTVENIKKSLKFLIKHKHLQKANSNSIDTSTIDSLLPTHYYLRATVVNESEKDRFTKLFLDINKPVHYFPIEFDTISDSTRKDTTINNYIDSNAKNFPIYLYVKAPSDFDFSLFDNITIDTLAELIIYKPSNNSNNNSSSNNILAKRSNHNISDNLNTIMARNNITIDSLLALSWYISRKEKDKSFLQKTNLNDMVAICWTCWTCNAKTPVANIYYYPDTDSSALLSSYQHGWQVPSDSGNAYAPVEDVPVHTYGWNVDDEIDHTDINGRASFERSCWSINFAIVWQRHDFELQEGGSITNTVLKGGTREGVFTWNAYMANDNAREYVIYRAARNYMYGDRDGIRKPHNNGWLNTNLDIEIYTGASSSPDVVGTFDHTSPVIEIYYRRGVGLFSGILSHNLLSSSTIHEMAHWSHHRHAGTDRFTGTSLKVKETWALTVEYTLNKKIFKTNEVTDNIPTYTLALIDMMDNHLDAPWHDFRDSVTGYSLLDIENKILANHWNWNTLRNDFKLPAHNKGNDPNEIDAIFYIWLNEHRPDLIYHLNFSTYFSLVTGENFYRQTFFDYDGDGDKDLFFSYVSSGTIKSRYYRSSNNFNAAAIPNNHLTNSNNFTLDTTILSNITACRTPRFYEMGSKDILMCGHWDHVKFYYRDTGSTDSFALGDSTILGNLVTILNDSLPTCDITETYCDMIPSLVDINGDTLKDLVIFYISSTSQVSYFKNDSTNNNPNFVRVSNDSNPFYNLQRGYYHAYPLFVKWSKPKLKNKYIDLVVADYNGNLNYYYYNTSNNKYKYDRTVNLTESRGYPTMTDLDNDNRKEIIWGSATDNVFMVYENKRVVVTEIQ